MRQWNRFFLFNVFRGDETVKYYKIDISSAFSRTDEQYRNAQSNYLWEFKRCFLNVVKDEIIVFRTTHIL